MAWVGDHLFSYAQALVAGFTINCPESGETVMNDLREIGPTYYFAPPRVFENLLTQVMIRMEDASALKRRLFQHFMDVAKRCGADLLDGKDVSGGDRLQYWLGNLFIYGPLQERARHEPRAGGLHRRRGDRARPVPLLPLDRHQPSSSSTGQTETCAYVCLQPDGSIKLDSVGTPAPNVRGQAGRQRRDPGAWPDAAEGLLQAPRRHRRVDQRRGLLHDRRRGLPRRGRPPQDHRPGQGRGQADRRRHVRPPTTSRTSSSSSSTSRRWCASATERDFVTAFVNIDLEAVGNWAERKGMAYAGYTDLASQPQVYELIRECIEQVNADLASDPNMSESQIKRFLVLHKELDADDGELTRTRKVRRNFVAEKYAVLIDALYGGKTSRVHRDPGDLRGRPQQQGVRRAYAWTTPRPSRPAAEGCLRRTTDGQKDWRRDRSTCRTSRCASAA